VRSNGLINHETAPINEHVEVNGVAVKEMLIIICR